MGTAKAKELEKLQASVQGLAARTLKAGEHEVARMLLDASAKLEQKIQGHRASRRRKK